MNITKVNYTLQYTKKNSFNILIIDDDIEVAEVLKQYLEMRGHNVTVVDEGSRGIYKISKNEYDIVFLDYHLNNCESGDKIINSSMDGSILTECIKEICGKSLQLIFAYTGDTSKKALDKFKQVGMDGVIFKPVEEVVLNRFMTSLETLVDKMHLSGTVKNYKNSVQVFS